VWDGDVIHDVGKARVVYANGDRYEGEFDGDHFRGRGAWRFAGGRRFYDGTWTRWPMGDSRASARAGGWGAG
jgi:hypothetical protein